MDLAITPSHLHEKTPAEFIEDKFDVLFSVVVHGNKLELGLLLRAFTKVLKCKTIFIIFCNLIFT